VPPPAPRPPAHARAPSAEVLGIRRPSRRVVIAQAGEVRSLLLRVDYTA